MNTISDPIAAAIQLANESYRSGYLEGYKAGQRDAIAHAVKLVQDLPTTPEEAAARRAASETPSHE